ncbi:G patch domain-containing protein 4 [Channa argus]|uniref:G patch domain-containing protein 4 n=1 Tax=Channa argus TaxID=215402 RepID=UPI002947B223|nr:hypothetical protein Q8A73_007586 [Channa argus]
MAEVVQEKSRGLKFAEQQLLRHGWEHGKGLGRGENGISEAIKVKVKCDKGGVGHKEGEQFTFHWWDHVFNKASSSLQVESDQNGIKLKKTAEADEENGMISNKKPRKATLAKAKLYGCFVKSATLLSGQEHPELKSSNSEDSSSSDEEDDQKLDLSSTTKLSDSDLMKACGGRTAHKGARHGLTMSAKLVRLEQQEAEFMAKYGKQSQTASASPSTVQSANQRTERQEETDGDAQGKTIKRKRSTALVNELICDDVTENYQIAVKLRKKKKKKKANEKAKIMTNASITEANVICVGNGEVAHSHKTKRKHKTKKNKKEQNGEQHLPSPAVNDRYPAETAVLQTDTKVKKKKKKKSSKHPTEEQESNYSESSQSELVQDFAPETKNTKTGVLLEEAKVAETQLTVKHKRKKSEKGKLSIDSTVNEEALPPKRKKSKQ